MDKAAATLLAAALIGGAALLLLLLCRSRLRTGRIRCPLERLDLLRIQRGSLSWPHREPPGRAKALESLWLPTLLRQEARNDPHAPWPLADSVKQADMLLFLEPSRALSGLWHARIAVPADRTVWVLPDLFCEEEGTPCAHALWLKAKEHLPAFSPRV